MDGYLYIFNTDERNGKAAMIYPHPLLNGGSNAIRAHVPVEVPSRREPDPENRWLHLLEGPATDRLFIVVSRQPLPNVPTGAELVRHCGQDRGCVWMPGEREWRALGLKVSAEVLAAKSRSFGQEPSADEEDAIERVVRLKPEAPPPATVQMSARDDAGLLVAVVDLHHRPRPQ